MYSKNVNLRSVSCDKLNLGFLDLQLNLERAGADLADWGVRANINMGPSASGFIWKNPYM